MKKRCVSFLVFICFLFGSVALADSFSIRNGITFGMTEEEVRAIEGDLEFRVMSSDEYNGDFSQFDVALNAKIEMLGCNTELFYCFDNDALTQIGMFLRDSNKTHSDTIYTALTEKYGNYSKYLQKSSDRSKYAASRVGLLILLGSEGLEWIINDETGIISICQILDWDNDTQIYYHFTPNDVLQEERNAVDELKNGI